jgi:hypothetical protein
LDGSPALTINHLDLLAGFLEDSDEGESDVRPDLWPDFAA